MHAAGQPGTRQPARPSSSSEGKTRRKLLERRPRSGADADGERSTRLKRSATGIMALASAEVAPPMISAAPCSKIASQALAARAASEPESRYSTSTGLAPDRAELGKGQADAALDRRSVDGSRPGLRQHDTDPWRLAAGETPQAHRQQRGTGSDSHDHEGAHAPHPLLYHRPAGGESDACPPAASGLRCQGHDVGSRRSAGAGGAALQRLLRGPPRRGERPRASSTTAPAPSPSSSMAAKPSRCSPERSRSWTGSAPVSTSWRPSGAAPWSSGAPSSSPRVRTSTGPWITADPDPHPPPRLKASGSRLKFRHPFKAGSGSRFPHPPRGGRAIGCLEPAAGWPRSAPPRPSAADRPRAGPVAAGASRRLVSQDHQVRAIWRTSRSSI